jgi:hypothetical protein
MNPNTACKEFSLMSAPTFPIAIFSGVVDDFRPGVTLESAPEKLGPLADLAGTWIGTGFNLISLPAFNKDREFELLLNTTVEVLEFEPIGAQVPNRGSFSGVPRPNGQDDINIYGLRYLQRVADGKKYAPLHVEPGFWLNVPATQWPERAASVVRQGMIPHGSSLLALGNHTESEEPSIPSICSFPAKHDGTDFANPSYLHQFHSPPGGFDTELVKDPNLALKKAIYEQNIIKTVTLTVSTENPKESDEDPDGGSGGIVNIPFIVKNANVTKFNAVFWIETVQNPNSESTFLQLQYTQTAILDFLNIDWPHISVATLIKQ